MLFTDHIFVTPPRWSNGSCAGGLEQDAASLNKIHRLLTTTLDFCLTPTLNSFT